MNWNKADSIGCFGMAAGVGGRQPGEVMECDHALAVDAFERNDPEAVRKNIREAGRLEQKLIGEVNAPENKQYGVCGAWPDYDFFLNWRLQLDKQLYEMRTDENKAPLSDCNPDVELFLPALLGV